ncbi:MAG: UDP-N-acetylmuramoyl-tripeptide--D-alanyl-D-alanine ligase [Acidobacteriota bacterium]|nr:UDP-N-acetylmuramoyl-tripeptide--D-alanyl-D-alanine ligase [Acidobacteriota bacterium]
MRWSLERVAQALALEPPAEMPVRQIITGVSIDSRTIRPNELYFAIRGQRHDGHDFVRAALVAGAAAAVVDRARLANFAPDLQNRLLGVDDTVKALGGFSRDVRRAWGAADHRLLAAVTGSSGKTTTKEILAALIESRMPVLRSEGNLNNVYGLPLTLCRLEETHQAAVVELGMSRRGELTELARIAEPEIGVVTNVAPAHLEFFASVEEIALAKRELIENLAGSDPLAVLNADDPRVARFAGVARGRVVTFGRGEGADFRASSIEDRGVEGSVFNFEWKGGRARLALPLVGTHNVMNALAALAAGSAWGIGAEDARTVFPRLAATGHRGRVLRFREGFTVLDDCYNSNPAALAAMIEWLAGAGGFERRILAAGEMLELGPASASLHREAGRWAAGRVDWIVGVQGNAEEIVRGAIEAGHPGERTRFFADAAEAAVFINELLRPGDLVVLKGSRGVRMERILELLTARYQQAEADAAGKRERR